MEEHIEEIKGKILPVLKHHDVLKAALFGSMARREAKESSNIDILVELPRQQSLLDFVALKLELEEALGRRVSLVEYSLIHPGLKERILREQLLVLS